MLRRCIVSLAVIGSLSAAAPAVGAAPEPVVTGDADQFGPGAEGDAWVGWTQYGKPTYDAHIRMQDGTGHQTLHRRTDSHSFFGGFDPSGEDVIIQDVKGNSSNVYLFHGDTQTFGAPPDGVNTTLWEWAPDMSARFILFGRNDFATGSSLWQVVLYDRTFDSFQVIASVENRCGCIWPEAVNERYAAWTQCVNRCQVYVYDTQTDIRTKVPNPTKQQYGAAVSEDGQVYFVRSGDTCSANPRILRYTIATDTIETVYVYPDGTNLASSLDLVDGADLNDDLYFDRARCGDPRYRGNIFRIRDVFSSTSMPASAPAAASQTAAGGAWRGPERPGAAPLG